MSGSIVLFYHSVAPARHPDPLGRCDRSVRVDVELFRVHMDILAQFFTIVPMDALITQVLRGAVQAGQACVTFDDGYADNYEHAFPILKRLGIPATIFLTTGPMEDGRPFWWERLAWHLSNRGGGRLALPAELGGSEVDLGSPDARTQMYDELAARLQILDNGARDRLLDTLGAEQPTHVRPLTWREAAIMQRAGIAFGGHSHTHPNLTALSDGVLREEIIRSRGLISMRLERTPSLFAYPFGELDARVARAVEDAGFTGAVTTCETLCSRASLRYRVPRYHVGNWDKQTFRSFLDKATNKGFENKCRSYLKAIIPAPVVAVSTRLRGAWRDWNRRTARGGCGEDVHGGSHQA
jgi:peptidoglycan/xylan/chitin deacetylase (PgdA/CDA1 family)